MSRRVKCFVQDVFKMEKNTNFTVNILLLAGHRNEEKTSCFAVCPDFVAWATEEFGDRGVVGNCTLFRGDNEVTFSFANDTCDLSSCGNGFNLTAGTLMCRPGANPEYQGAGRCEAGEFHCVHDKDFVSPS